MGCSAIILVLQTARSGSGWASAQEDAWRNRCGNSTMAGECLLDWFEGQGHSFDDVSSSDEVNNGFSAGAAWGS